MSLTATPQEARRLLARARLERLRRERERRNPRYARDMPAFAADVLGVHLWSKQREVAEKLTAQDRVSVRACHGVGKTKIGGVAAIWFLTTFENSRVITTAPTWAQVRDLLWRSIRADVSAAQASGKLVRYPMPDQVKWDLGPNWFATGLSTDQSERFQGHHADHLLLIVDEASGVDEDIYEAAEGFMTAEGAKVLLIGNPTRIGGQFHRSHTSERDQWATVSISVFDTPNYTGESVPAQVARSLPRASWADEKAKSWGVDSPAYQVRVLGQFSDTSDRNVIGLGDVENAQARVISPAPSTTTADDRAVISCDVARFGSDDTVIVERVGWRVRIVETFNGRDTVHTANRVAHHADKHDAGSRDIVIDDDGVGGGVTDILRGRGYAVHGFQGGAKAHHSGKFPNRRSEAWHQAAAVLDEVDLDGDEQLLADLTSPEYRMDDKGRRVVEKKADTKKRLGRSPDRGDAVVMALSFRVPTPEELRRQRERRDASDRRPRARTYGLRERAARGT